MIKFTRSTLLYSLAFSLTSIAVLPILVSAQSIINGKYQHNYPDDYGVEIRNKLYSVYYDDDSPEPFRPITTFKSIKAGVLYDSYGKKHYCLVSSLEKKVMVGFVCSRNGWIKSIKKK